MSRPAVPFHFGTGERRLFGVYHSPDRASSERGVLICYPLGLDYIRSHRVFQRLASTLAEGGSHVLRFDYFGCGDSGGNGDESTLQDWLGDVQTAMEELRDMSGAGRLSIVGARLGGTLAAMQAGHEARLERLVLWDPILRGAGHLDRLLGVDRGLIEDRTRFTMPRRRDDGAYRHQLLGFPMTPEQRASIGALDLATPPLCNARQVLIAVSEDRADYRRYAAALEAAGVEVAFRHLPGTGDWDELSRVEQVHFPGTIVAAIADWMAEGR